MKWIKKTVAALLLSLAIVGVTAGHTTEPILPVPQEAFTPIVIASLAPTLYGTSYPPVESTPKATAIPTAKPKPKPTAKPKIKTSLTRPDKAGIIGVASWYCKSGVSRCTRGHPSGMYAAIRKDLLYLRGKIVTVCAKRCIQVRIIDCNCGPNANLIDLYSTAFSKLAPLSRGKVNVTLYR